MAKERTRALLPRNVNLGHTFIKITEVFENQSVWMFGYNYTAVLLVVLMGNAIVQSLEHDLLIIFIHFMCKQFILRQQPGPYVADFGLQLRCRQKERRRKMLISSFISG